MKPTPVSGVLAIGLSAVASGYGSAAPVDYFAEIKPLLAVHCLKCHDDDTAKGGLRLDRLEHARTGGKSGLAAVVPGDGLGSEVWRRLVSPDPEERMPPPGEGAALSAAEAERVRRWIDEGAAWPEHDDYWAFQPPSEVAVPPGQADHPVDRFVDTALATAGLAPNPPADRRTLLRRAFFNLIGLPPTPEEADAYFNDTAPGAFARLIDRLLADPRYGERWARHWLDVVRYGESDGYEDDKVRPLAWRYRDYVIRSLNADKPYDRFLREQIAGDELWPEDPDAWTATGFARLGAWDGMSREPEKQRQDFLNDTTDAVGSVFLGVTLGCARCHDHKYDSISQHDYFRMQAHFAGIERERKDLPGPIPQPVAVAEKFRASQAEAHRLQSEREELWNRATAALVPASGQTSQPPDDGEIRKQADLIEPGRLGKLDDQLKVLNQDLRFLEPAAEAIANRPGEAPPTRILKGGELSRPGEGVAPGFPEAMAGPAPPAVAASLSFAAGRRTALADWLGHPDHPLTARVMVNRVWQHHFGAGLVATASDFGRNGKPPTHPELLDWLAREFVKNGWSQKHVHRLLMTSAAWQRSADTRDSPAERDPDNRWLWRGNRHRLEAEAIRDTILAVSGTLSPAMGGPGVYAPLPAAINVEFPNNDKELSWGSATPEEGRRRSVYLFQRRTLTYPLMEIFDAAPMNQSCATRAVTTVAPQALALFNGEFARGAARDFANRLRREAGTIPDRQAERAFAIAFTRPPTAAEQAAVRHFLSASPDPPEEQLVDFCHALLNANELIYVD